MSNKKNKTQKHFKPIRGNTNLLGFIKEALTLIGGLAGSILAIYGLVKTFRDDAEGFSWLILVGIGIWLYLLWQLFQVRKTTAYSLFIISVLIGVVGWVGWKSQVKATENKVVVLVAQFDGPEETYGMRRQMIEDLLKATKNYDDTFIIEGDKLVTSGEYARQLGKQEKADLVIWAWYRPTENPNITIHFENLSTTQFKELQESETYQPQATLADLESFEIQHRLGSETSTLISFLSGLLRYKAGDYQIALARFEQILTKEDISDYLKIETLYSYMGFSHFFLREYDQAIKDFDKAIELNPSVSNSYDGRGITYYYLGQYERALDDYNKSVQLDPSQSGVYNNRGLNYIALGQYKSAIDDCSKAIELDPKDDIAYHNRGYAYYYLGQNDNAIKDYNKAVELNPNYTKVYNNRGLVYSDLMQYDHAIEDYDKAIELNPKFFITYYNRGRAYFFLKQYNRAIQDLDKAIELHPNYPEAYVNRGIAYEALAQYERAIKDYDKAIQLNPKDALAYYNRGVAYQKLGKTAEAEADLKKYEELTGEKP